MKLIDLFALIAGCFLLGSVFMALSNRRVDAAARRQRWLKFVVYFFIVQLVVGSAWLGHEWTLVLALLIIAIGGWELRRAARMIAVSRPLTARLVGVAYLAIGSGFVATLLVLPPSSVAFVYVVVAVFDGFSQVVGQWLGRRPLAARLSPGKTVEGTIGGVVAALAIAWFMRGLVALDAPALLLVGALAIACCALIGDLSASWVKRRAGIKDFSALLPGQGGVLDRFDSFIGAGALLAPAVLIGAALQASGGP